jgi:hypothetical protein
MAFLSSWSWPRDFLATDTDPPSSAEDGILRAAAMRKNDGISLRPRARVYAALRTKHCGTARALDDQAGVEAPRLYLVRFVLAVLFVR